MQYIVVGVIILVAGTYAVVKIIKRLRSDNKACNESDCCGCPLDKDCKSISDRYKRTE